MICFLKKQMDPTLEAIVPTLIKRACETSGFICEEADRALAQMVACSGDRQVLATLLAACEQRTGVMKSKAALHLASLFEKAGRGWLGRDQGGQVDRVLPLMVGFLGDSNPDTRRYGRRGIYLVASLFGDPSARLEASGELEFQRKAKAVLSEASYRKAVEAVAHGKSNGGHALQEGGGAGRWNASKRGQIARLTASASSGSGPVQKSWPAAADPAEDLNLSGERFGDAVRGGGPRARRTPRVQTSHRAANEIKELEVLPRLFTQMGSSDWRQRHTSLGQLGELVLRYPAEIAPKLVAVFDHWTLRMADGNSKVLLLSLSLLAKMIPELGNQLELVLSTLVPALAQQIASSNAAIKQAGGVALDLLLTHVDSTSLVQHLTDQIAFGNPRSLATIVTKVAQICRHVYGRKPDLVMRHVVPRGVRLVDDSASDTRQAVTELLGVLNSCIGDKLLETNMSDQQRRKVAAAIAGDSNYHRCGANSNGNK
jgi:hypothetical protein